jgi:hypothetical protein
MMAFSQSQLVPFGKSTGLTRAWHSLLSFLQAKAARGRQWADGRAGGGDGVRQNRERNATSDRPSEMSRRGNSSSKNDFSEKSRNPEIQEKAENSGSPNMRRTPTHPNYGSNSRRNHGSQFF